MKMFLRTEKRKSPQESGEAATNGSYSGPPKRLDDIRARARRKIAEFDEVVQESREATMSAIKAVERRVR